MEMAKDALTCILTRYSSIYNLDEDLLNDIFFELEDKLNSKNIIKKENYGIYTFSMGKNSKLKSTSDLGDTDTGNLFNSYEKSSEYNEITSEIPSLAIITPAYESSDSTNPTEGIQQKNREEAINKISDELYSVFYNIKERNRDIENEEINIKLLNYLNNIIKY